MTAHIIVASQAIGLCCYGCCVALEPFHRGFIDIAIILTRDKTFLCRTILYDERLTYRDNGRKHSLATRDAVETLRLDL